MNKVFAAFAVLGLFVTPAYADQCAPDEITKAQVEVNVTHTPGARLYALKDTGLPKMKASGAVDADAESVEFLLSPGIEAVGIIQYKHGCYSKGNLKSVPLDQITKLFQDAGVSPDEVIRVEGGA